MVIYHVYDIICYHAPYLTAIMHLRKLEVLAVAPTLVTLVPRNWGWWLAVVVFCLGGMNVSYLFFVLALVYLPTFHLNSW